MTAAGPPNDELTIESSAHFRGMVQSVGVKKFSACMDLSTRQINRMLSGAQPNPVERLVRCLQSCHPDVGDEALSFVCQEAGGQFIKDEAVDLDTAGVNAVRECAEAIRRMPSKRYMRLQGLLPLVVHSGEPRSAMVIAFGTGITAGSLLAFPHLERRLVVELLAPVVEEFDVLEAG